MEHMRRRIEPSFWLALYRNTLTPTYTHTPSHSFPHTHVGSHHEKRPHVCIYIYVYIYIYIYIYMAYAKRRKQEPSPWLKTNTHTYAHTLKQAHKLKQTHLLKQTHKHTHTHTHARTHAHLRRLITCMRTGGGGSNSHLFDLHDIKRLEFAARIVETRSCFWFADSVESHGWEALVHESRDSWMQVSIRKLEPHVTSHS